MKVVIVGGVAGGMSTAARLRRLDERAEIVVLEKGPHVSYANCGLPYHLGGVIEDRDALLLQTPGSLRARFALDVRTGHEALSVDPAARTVTVRAGDTVYAESYDHLVLSPGARPVVPDVPGIGRALALRDVTDTDRIGAAAEGAGTAVVIGGGFIGVELAENLRRRGLEVALVERDRQVLPPLDPEMAAPLAAELSAHGVDVRLGTEVTKVLPRAVELSDGTTLPAGLVVLAIGVRPDTALARTAGLTIGARGGIAVDERQRTSDPRIHAVGDAAEKPDHLTGEAALVPLANLANRHGRLVADALAGRPVRSAPAIGTAVARVFGLTAAATGWNEKRLAAAGRPHRVLHVHPASHAGYYPGARPLALKLLVDPGTQRILGAQAVGAEGADKRIDVLATAIRGGLTAPELADLELAYAPPYGSAKDPVNMLGHVADNLATGTTATLQWHELDRALADGAVLVDVRSPAEHRAGAIPGARNIPVDALRARIAELPADRPVIVHCQVGVRGHVAARLLAQHGRRVHNLDGGYLTWNAARAVPGARGSG
ncbi:FAD-dependent oxidoreductase [Streptomyces showdoensis]|uniref:CoA-disulfide reductase n=1 Tax=Streptomyces showdoensis TaxID=68268 RepID=A0A2P2GU99_STREW|nr:FAD-dependent oxidoreductase [Streptomyces showdoensis]KKZ75074.1 CoA-disulfide reductase [Streptomyces showdoensis]